MSLSSEERLSQEMLAGGGAGSKIISRKAMIRIALSNTIDDGLLIYLKQ